MTNIDTGRENSIVRDRLTPSLGKPPWVLLRIGGGVAAAVVLGSIALVGYFFGGITATDCFIECGGEPNLLVGIPILLGTAAVGALGLGALWWAFVDRYWKSAFKVIGIAGSIGAIPLVMAVLAST
jgi:hypothetical protein